VPDDALEALRLEVRRLELQAERRKVRDGFKLPAGVYELIQDHAIIDAAMNAMRRVWHKDCDEYRKASMHLSKLEWDLRKRLQDLL